MAFKNQTNRSPKRALAYTGAAVVVIFLVVLTSILAPGRDTMTSAATEKKDNIIASFNFPKTTGHDYHIECTSQGAGHSCWKIDITVKDEVKFSDFTIPAGSKYNITASCDSPGLAFPPKQDGVNLHFRVTKYHDSDDPGKVRLLFTARWDPPGDVQNIYFYGEVNVTPQTLFQPVSTSKIANEYSNPGEVVTDSIATSAVASNGQKPDSVRKIWPYKYNDDEDRKEFRSVRYCVYAIGSHKDSTTASQHRGFQGPMGRRPLLTAADKWFETGSDGTFSARHGTANNPWSTAPAITGAQHISHKCFPTGRTTTPGDCATRISASTSICDGASYKVAFDGEAGIPDSQNWKPGYYYFVTRIKGSKADYYSATECRTRWTAEHGQPWPGQLNDTQQARYYDDCTSQAKPDAEGEVVGQTDDYISESIILNGTDRGNLIPSKSKYWYSPFGETTELAIRRFQPLATSKITNAYVDATNPARDVITPLAASSLAEAKKYENGDTTADINEAYWLKGSNGQHLTVKYCVTAYGPSNHPLPYNQATLPAGLNKIDSPVCQEISPSTSNHTFEFAGSLNWAPGYYYFMTSVEKAGQTNADYLIGDWTSNFNPNTHSQKEYIISPFQPIARSAIAGRPSRDQNNHGVIFDCEENILLNQPSILQGSQQLEELPKEELTCHKLTDHIYLGAIGKNGVDAASKNVSGNNNNDYWLRDEQGNYEPVQFQVKLYGPFANAQSPKNPADFNVYVGRTEQTVPASVVSAAAQPAAQSCVITANYGPNWDNFKPGSDHQQTEKTSNQAAGYYQAVFTQRPETCANGHTTATDLALKPGIYHAVVEILKDGMNQQASLIAPGVKVADMIPYPFYSQWADPYESVMLPLPIFMWTERGNSSQFYYDPPVNIQDAYWLVGFGAKYGKPKTERKDILGNPIPAHGSYAGNPGYFDKDNPDTKKATISLYGPYENMPVDGGTYCSAAKLIHAWNAEPKDTDGQKLTSGVTLTNKGYYVFQMEYAGDDRVAHLLTPCSDLAEMLKIGKEPALVTQIQTGTGEKKAPNVIHDEIAITGDVDDGSVVKLTLYQAQTATKNPAADKQLCVVKFTVKRDEYLANHGHYYTKNMVDETGKVKPGYGEGRCFAETSGHYYWYEEFERPPSGTDEPGQPYHPPNPGGPGEEIDLEPNPPKVETTADISVKVGDPFSDIAHVTIPKGDDKTYYLYFEAYGPSDQMYCDSSNLIFTTITQKLKVNETGSYQSPATSVTTPGTIWWIEYLVDGDGNIVAKGHCGAKNEITRVYEPVVPNTPGSFLPFTPDAGFITRQVIKIIALGAIISLGAWQLTSRGSWLYRQR